MDAGGWSTSVRCVDVEKDESTTLTADSARAAFYRLTRTDLPVATTALFDTAGVFGGASPGLLAARVLANHALHRADRRT